MSLLKIKVSGITSLTDARYCAGMGVKYLSICFDESGNSALSPTEFKAIQAWIEGVEWMGEFEGSDPEILKSLSADFGLTLWIVNELILSNSGENLGDLDCILSISEPKLESQSKTKAVEIEIHGDESFLQDLLVPDRGMIILKNPSSADQIIQLFQQNPDLIFNLKSGEEERPGWMDLSNLQDILEEIEAKGIFLF
jgi:phosphoribosylanthranilate isomerase